MLNQGSDSLRVVLSVLTR